MFGPKRDLAGRQLLIVGCERHVENQLRRMYIRRGATVRFADNLAQASEGVRESLPDIMIVSEAGIKCDLALFQRELLIANSSMASVKVIFINRIHEDGGRRDDGPSATAGVANCGRELDAIRLAGVADSFEGNLTSRVTSYGEALPI